MAGKHEARLDAIAEDVTEIKGALQSHARHEGRLDVMAEEVTEIKECLRQNLKSHEKRLQRLERWRAGLVATITVVSSYLGIDKIFHLR